MKKYLLSLIFSLCLLFSLVPQNVQAAGMDAESQTPDGTIYTSEDQIAEALREVMVAREESAKLICRLPESSFDGTVESARKLSERIFESAMKHTGVTCEGDYLRYHMDYFTCAYSWTQGKMNTITLNYKMKYYSTAEQEAQVEEAVAAALKNLSLDGKDTPDKIKAIYSYITQNVVYDYDHLEDSAYKLKYSAYAAITDKTSVCQGYANLLYRMLLAAGIDSRIITGFDDKGGAHAWNIVEIDGEYYMLDATWDAGMNDNSYRYFLKGTSNFANHVSDERFTAAAFRKEYPLSETDWTKKDNNEMNAEKPVKDQNPFVDVEENRYYYDPVLWAASVSITSGVDATHFAPGQDCTRGQIVTFLWRSVGCPEPTEKNNPFVDISEKDYYYKAVLWAVENGITYGMDATHFGPGESCTRGQVVTFLWRSSGSTLPESQANEFNDVAADAYYYQPVLWAVENGITAGVGIGRFAPGETCTRGQIVTFLYRSVANK